MMGSYTVRLTKKLETMLQGSLDTEERVIAFMVLTRKLLEAMPSKKRQEYRTLQFYCDWVVHTKLDREGAERLLKKGSEQESDEVPNWRGFQNLGFPAAVCDLAASACQRWTARRLTRPVSSAKTKTRISDASAWPANRWNCFIL